jgi:predicted enzyme related to lactoylglutathione lyase
MNCSAFRVRGGSDNYCALWSLDELVGQTSKRGGIMAENSQRITSFAPQLLMDDLERAIKLYSDVLGFSFGPTWRGFYAIGERDGFSVHLKCAPKVVEDRANRRQHQHLDVYASVIGVSALYADCKAKGATILKPLNRTPWGTNDFYLEDPEGYIIAFGEPDNSTIP